MRRRDALRSPSVLRAATLLSLVGGTVLLATDEKVIDMPTAGMSFGLALKMLATYAALFAGAVWAAVDADEREPVHVPTEQP